MTPSPLWEGWGGGHSAIQPMNTTDPPQPEHQLASAQMPERANASRFCWPTLRTLLPWARAWACRPKRPAQWARCGPGWCLRCWRRT